MPFSLRIPCPQCGKTLYRKPAGRCPDCNAPVSDHVAAARAREERIEKIVAVIGTILVLLLFFLTNGLGLLEGVAMYAAAGVAMFYLAKKTFTPHRSREE
jgi:hypothetical protein